MVCEISVSISRDVWVQISCVKASLCGSDSWGDRTWCVAWKESTLLKFRAIFSMQLGVGWCMLFKRVECTLLWVTILSTVDYEVLYNTTTPSFVGSGHPKPEAFIEEWESSAKEGACDWVRSASNEREWKAEGEGWWALKERKRHWRRASYFSF